MNVSRPEGWIQMVYLKADNQSVQNYIKILQTIINRMASNSTSCKTWCITLVSAMLVIIIDKGKIEFISLAYIPLFLFLFLDAYYLGLENSFCDFFDNFVKNLRSEKATLEDLYAMPKTNWIENIEYTFKAFGSLSVFPFYVLLFLMIYSIKCWV